MLKSYLRKTKELRAWKSLYLLYDANKENMANHIRYTNLRKESAKELHAEAVEIADALIAMGYNGDMDVDLNENLKSYFTEARLAA